MTPYADKVKFCPGCGEKLDAEDYGKVPDTGRAYVRCSECLGQFSVYPHPDMEG